MSLTLTPRDIKLLQRAMRSLLGPLQHHRSDAWALDVCRSIRELMQVDSVVAILRGPKEPTIVGDGALSGNALRMYLGSWHHRIPGDDLRRSQRLTSWVRDAVWPRRDLERTAYYNDYCVPFGNRHSAGMSASEDGSDGMVIFLSSGGDARFLPGGREAMLLALLQPALAAGARFARLHSVPGSSDTPATASLDPAVAAVALVTMDGRLLHATPPLASMLRESGAAEHSLVEEIQCLAREMSLLVRDRPTAAALGPTRQIDTPRGCVTLTASIVDESFLGTAPLCLIAVSPPPSAPARDSLSSPFGLTGREAQVASLLAAGQRNREVAASLGVSEHTARRHTERVMSKLGVTSRAAVHAALSRAHQGS